MNHRSTPSEDIKRVGRSGQISLGKKHAGHYFRESHLEDGSIVLVPVVVLPKSHWSVRDGDKIRKAIEWAAANPGAESSVDEVVARAQRGVQGRKRGR